MKSKFYIFVLLVVVVLSSSVYADKEMSFKVFERMPILAEGRVKPMDTYARNLLLRFSGRRSYERKSAVSWLASFLFTPDRTRDDKIFLINNPDIPVALGLEPDKKRRYSFSQLEPAYPKLTELAKVAYSIEDKARTPVEGEIIRVFENIRLYADISHAFAFARPHSDFTITNPDVARQLRLPKGQTQFSFIDIAIQAESIKTVTNILETKSPESWTSEERQVIGLLTNLYQWSLVYKNLPFHIMPWFDSAEEIWIGPWDMISRGFHIPEVRTEILLLRDMAKSYRKAEQMQFDISTRGYIESISQRVDPKAKRSVKYIPLELAYNKCMPFLMSKIFYGLAFLVFLISLGSSRKLLYPAAYVLVLAGGVIHAIALTTRIVILARPPVSNLYETFIFVGFVSVLLGLIIEAANKKWLGIVVSSLCGFVFLLIASKFSAEGDTLKMLVAVLNSNFWLGTHVLSITIGYAGTCVAGVIGHVYLLQSIFQPRDRKLQESTYRYLLGALGFGLTMTFLGTNLGGIWADQSWGRFWGWDPKENGALLIILWTAIVFHAKIGKIIGPRGVAVGSILGIIVVMWAWFGVNLLSTGLHSYGFTSGIAAGLIIYVVSQLLFLAITIPIARKKSLALK